MGIERLVPTLDDLALMLRLLPRSATGQKLTVYTSLIHGPRRPGDPDGPQERHLILVDNGRSKPARHRRCAEMLYCIRCGACLNACPVFREIGGHAYVGMQGQGSPYPGPIGCVLSPALFGQAEFGQLARASSLCGACQEACPVDIDLPRLLLRVRAGGRADAGNSSPEPNAPVTLKLGLRGCSAGWRPRPGVCHLAKAGRLGGLAGSADHAWHAEAVAALAAPARLHRLGLFSKDFPRPAAQYLPRALAKLRARASRTADSREGAAQPVQGMTRLQQARSPRVRCQLEAETLAALQPRAGRAGRAG